MSTIPVATLNGRSQSLLTTRLLAEAKLIEDPSKSDRQICRELGCSRETVTIIRRRLVNEGVLLDLQYRKGADGKLYTKIQKRGHLKIDCQLRAWARQLEQLEAKLADSITTGNYASACEDAQARIQVAGFRLMTRLNRMRRES